MTTQDKLPVPVGRLHALDGIRGLAALVVVFTHLNGIAYTQTLPDPDRISDLPTWLSWAFQTAILASGTQSVFVFFLLSGIVITLPVLKARDYNWYAYYPRRLVRLYVPAIASLLFSGALVFLIHRDVAKVDPEGWFVGTNIITFSGRKLASELTLFDSSFLYNGPLWSIVWEILFSCLLPLFVVIAVLVRRWWLWGIIGCFAINAYAGYFVLLTPGILSMFLIGCIIAVRLDRVRALGARLHATRWGGVVTAALLIAAALMLLSRVLLPQSLVALREVAVLTSSAWLLGCLIIVLLGITSPTSIRVLSTRVIQWLGKISFSLYLVHVPVLATLGFVLGDKQWLLVITIGLPLCLAVGYGFYRLVESPSHRLSHRVGTASAAARDRFVASRGIGAVTPKDEAAAPADRTTGPTS